MNAVAEPAPPAGDVLVRVRGLSFSYGPRRVFENIDLTSGAARSRITGGNPAVGFRRRTTDPDRTGQGPVTFHYPAPPFAEALLGRARG